MTRATDFLAKVIEGVASGIDKAAEELATQIGESGGRELLSNEKQMELYVNMTAEDIQRMTLVHGNDAVARYIATMEMRRRKRNGSTAFGTA